MHYSYIFTDDGNTTWKVEIKDTTYQGETFMILKPDVSGFILNWEGASSETYKALITSSVEITVFFDENSRRLLFELASSEMGRFEVVISKKVSTVFVHFWYGFVMQDTMEKPDDALNTNYISFTATDGFGELQETEYTGFDTGNPARKTFIEWMAVIATKLPFTYASGTIFKTASNWYEKNMPRAGQDPLMNTYIYESAFVEVDEYNVVKGLMYYDILTYLFEVFNLQMSLWNGIYLIIQQNSYSRPVQPAWNYDKTGAYVSSETLYLQAAMPERLTGGAFTYLAPIRKITTEYEYKNGIFDTNLLPEYLTKDTVYDMGYFDLGYMRITGHIAATLFGDATWLGAFAGLCNIIIRNGNKYLVYKTTSVGQTLVWSTIPGSIPIKSETLYATAAFNGNLVFFLPVDLTFAITYENLSDPVSFYFGEESYIVQLMFPGAGNVTVVLGDGAIVATGAVSAVADEKEGTALYEAHVIESIKYNLELPTSIIGDGFYIDSAGGIRINDVNGLIIPSEGWTIAERSDDTPINVHSLRCREMLALRRVTTTFYEGSFLGIPDIHKGFTWDGENWIWANISWTANLNQFTGTSIALKYGTDE